MASLTKIYKEQNVKIPWLVSIQKDHKHTLLNIKKSFETYPIVWR